MSISECFAPLLRVRDTINSEVEKVRKEASTGGYVLIGAQLATGASFFLPFVKKNFENHMKEYVGLGIYMGFMFVVGVMIFASLYHLLKKFKNLGRRREVLLIETEIVLKSKNLVCAAQENIGVIDASVERLAQEDSILGNIIQITEPLDFGFMGRGLIWAEMVVASAAFISIPLIATWSRLS